MRGDSEAQLANMKLLKEALASSQISKTLYEERDGGGGGGGGEWGWEEDRVGTLRSQRCTKPQYYQTLCRGRPYTIQSSESGTSSVCYFAICEDADPVPFASAVNVSRADPFAPKSVLHFQVQTVRRSPNLLNRNV